MSRLRWLPATLALSAGLLLLGLLEGCGRESAPELDPGGPLASWPVWGGDPGGRRYSPLTQITPENVSRLRVVWTHHSGDLADGRAGPRGAHEATPILVGSTLYYCSPFNRVFALDARTGAELWVHDPRVDRSGRWGYTCRGVTAWSDSRASSGAPCAVRIFTGTTDARLIALDARTGLLCSDFGDGGSVDLRRGLGEVRPGEYRVTSPPTVIGDVVAVGAMVIDARRLDVPGGVVRGFDARSGELRWAFDPVPPGTPTLPRGADGEPRFHRSTPNAWGVFSADPVRDLLLVPTGNPSPDFYGAHRTRLDHYGSAVVALRGSTGEVVWSFQTVHHDLWDYDVAAQPTLIDLPHDGTSVPAVLQATKMGHLFLLERESGRPIFPIEERPVPQSDLPGERTAPTQPFPSFPPPLHPARLSPEDAWGLTPWDRAACRRRLQTLRNEGIFTPPSLEGSVEYPGVAGGVNWGGVAYDPPRNLVVVNITRVANVQTAVPRAEADGQPGRPPATILFPQDGTPYLERQDVLLSPLGIPCSPRPWGSLLALDLRSGEVRWEVPFGTTRDRAPLPIPLRWGMPSMGGPIVTAGGLVFIGAALDDYLRAYDVRSGEELWRARLPAGGQATPITYRLGPGERQYVVIAAGGHATLGSTPGDALVAFALP
ncbi:MAG: pyrroloquinoline quinone-dependent dehydrogenase [Myxococcota bacterium]